MLLYDHHVHAFGCLQPEDLWNYLHKTGRERKGALDWYAQTYELAFLEKPDWEKWLSSPSLEDFSRFYLCKAPLNFAQFQAKFNLIIALCDLGPKSIDLLEFAMERHALEGLRQVEYRFPVPVRLSQVDMYAYFELVSQLLQKVNERHRGQFTATAAFTLPREIAWYPLHYQWLRLWMEKHAKKALFFTAIDFSYFEENDEILEKQDFFSQIKEDNFQNPDLALAILVHVGETFESIPAGLSMLRVLEAAMLGADRIGHGSVLGFSFEQNLLRPQIQTMSHETLQGIQSRMKAHGLTWDYELKDQAIVEEQRMLSELQEQVLLLVKKAKTPFEHCPSSSSRLSGSQKSTLGAFLRHKIDTVICSDDPGLFNTTLQNEFHLASHQFPDLNIEVQNQLAKSLRSEVLSGKIQVESQLF
ncbi:MAG: hypothetical protein WCI18_09515 [Pseudomonadota bacterium]